MSDDRPVPINLEPYVHMLPGAREFLRMWAGADDGPVLCFINPVPIGADPMAFGIALVDAARHASNAYARATGCTEREAYARIWEGVEAERTRPTDPANPFPDALEDLN